MNFHKLVLIGVLFQFIDINIGIEILPDFIGFLIIAYAFSKVAVSYGKLGMYCSIVLSISSFFDMFLQNNQGIYLYEADFWIQLVNLAVSLFTIIYFACIFIVSNEILKIKKSSFPKIFIGAQIVMELLIAAGMHIPFNELELFYILILIPFFFLYIAFILFLWKRKNVEKELYKEMPSQ